jgi:hypothetical protein
VVKVTNKYFFIIYQVLYILTAVFERDDFYYRMRPKCLGLFQEWYPHMKRKTKSHIDMYHHTFSLRGTALAFPQTQSFRFLYTVWGGEHLNPYYVGLQLNVKVTNTFLISFIPLTTAPGPSKWCDIPWLYVSVRALIQVDDMLNFWCDSYLINGNHAAIFKLGTSALKVLCRLSIQCYVVTVLIV